MGDLKREDSYQTVLFYVVPAGEKRLERHFPPNRGTLNLEYKVSFHTVKICFPYAIKNNKPHPILVIPGHL